MKLDRIQRKLAKYHGCSATSSDLTADFEVGNALEHGERKTRCCCIAIAIRETIVSLDVYTLLWCYPNSLVCVAMCCSGRQSSGVLQFCGHCCVSWWRDTRVSLPCPCTPRVVFKAVWGNTMRRIVWCSSVGSFLQTLNWQLQMSRKCASSIKCFCSFICNIRHYIVLGYDSMGLSVIRTSIHLCYHDRPIKSASNYIPEICVK